MLGETSYPDLEAIPEAIDIVDIFRRSEFVPEIVEAAIRKGAKVIWMQEGVIHEAAARRATEAGLTVVMDRCILKDHRRLGLQSEPRRNRFLCACLCALCASALKRYFSLHSQSRRLTDSPRHRRKRHQPRKPIRRNRERR